MNNQDFLNLPKEGWKPSDSGLAIYDYETKVGVLRALRMVRAIDTLTANEGESILIPSGNADFNGLPNYVVDCCGEWTGWIDKRFGGDTLVEALEKAVHEQFCKQNELYPD